MGVAYPARVEQEDGDEEDDGEEDDDEEERAASDMKLGVVQHREVAVEGLRLLGGGSHLEFRRSVDRL